MRRRAPLLSRRSASRARCCRSLCRAPHCSARALRRVAHPSRSRTHPLFASSSLSTANFHNTAKAFEFALVNFAAPASRAFLEEALCDITQLMLSQTSISPQYTTFVESLLHSATALAVGMAREVDIEKYGALLRDCIDPRQPIYARSASDRAYDLGIPRAHGRCCDVALERGAAALVAEALEATEGWPGHTLVDVAVNVAAQLDVRAAKRPDVSEQCARALAIVQARFAELNDEELKADKSTPPLAWANALAKALPANPRFRFKLDVAHKLLRSGTLKVCSYLPLHFKRILLTILTCPPHILTF